MYEQTNWNKHTKWEWSLSMCLIIYSFAIKTTHQVPNHCLNQKKFVNRRNEMKFKLNRTDNTHFTNEIE